MTSRVIRPATTADVAPCVAIYAPYVTDTLVTFEETVPTAGAFAVRIATAQQQHAFLVLEEGGVVLGYAYAVPMYDRPAYRWACEVSVYLGADAVGGGRGRALYAELLARLRERGYRRVFAKVTLPNEASIGLHTAFGFRFAGTLELAGFKHGTWASVAILQLDLDDTTDRAAAPAPIA
ncbi:GNAT family N-acetyltransferase [Microbacterium gorillae]|uniref:GNAT family N-acetyltransferase n=1 Tax=Microbacterium gorillae TaxID=1231063 RepID=UPI0006947548|nr:GNAT family N-acetyltransferase [Microbacterium gorillae]